MTGREAIGSSADSAADLILVDGEQSRTIDAVDRGLQFGDGIFETIACVSAGPRFLDLHLARLARGCRALRISFDAEGALRNEITQAAAGASRSLLKVVVTRGRAVARGYGFTGAERPTRIVYRHPWPQDSNRQGRDGVAVRIAALRLGENPALAGIKHLNRLEQVLARAECPVSDYPELLTCDASGALISGTMSNVFFVVGGRIVTPAIERCGVAGVMREVVMSVARRAGIEVQVRPAMPAELDDAQEIFLTNARIGIWPVNRLAMRTLAVGPVTRQLQELMAPLLGGSLDA